MFLRRNDLGNEAAIFLERDVEFSTFRLGIVNRNESFVFGFAFDLPFDLVEIHPAKAIPAEFSGSIFLEGSQKHAPLERLFNVFLLIFRDPLLFHETRERGIVNLRVPFPIADNPFGSGFGFSIRFLAVTLAVTLAAAAEERADHHNCNHAAKTT